MPKLPGDLLNRWVRLRERLEGYSPQMEAHDMHIDWSDICVLDAFLTDAWDESYMGPEPGSEADRRLGSDEPLTDDEAQTLADYGDEIAQIPY